MVCNSKIRAKIIGQLFICRKRAALFISVVILVLVTTSVYSVAEEPTPILGNLWLNAWLSQRNFTGDWGGLRSNLESKGVDFSANFTTDIAGNPSGGKRRGVNYAGFLQGSVALDFEKLISLKGWALTVTNYITSGRNLSNEIGNFYGVQEIFAPGDYYFGQIDLSFTMLEDKLILEGGRLFAGDNFATSDLWQYYMSGGINGNLISISGNVFFPNFQVATWGARATYEPDKQWNFSVAAYNANPKVADTFRHGLDFSFNTDYGYLGIVQAAFKHHQDHEEIGLPGSVTVGGYYESSKFNYLSDSAQIRRGNYGVYFIIDQMLFRGDWPEFIGPSHLRSEAKYSEKVKHPYYQQTADPMDRPVGLTAWWSTYVAPQEDINAEVYQLAGGLVYQGLFSCRKRDVTAFCVLYGKFSDDLPGRDAETVLEFNHRFQLGSWFYVTPNIQYVFNPNGQHNVDNALVLGAETSFNF